MEREITKIEAIDQQIDAIRKPVATPDRNAEFSNAIDGTIRDFIEILGVRRDYAAALLRAKADLIKNPA